MPRCKVCRKKFEAKYFLQKACLNPKCLAEWSKKDRQLKVTTIDKANKIQKKSDNVRKKALMTRSDWYKRLTTEINRWIVHVRDKDKGCYTCGKTDPSVKYDCGHRHHAGRGGGDRRRFIEENLHKQCSMSCNQHGGGMPVEYDLALDREYGAGFADKLKCIDNYPTLKELFPTHHDIELEVLKYRKLNKELNK